MPSASHNNCSMFCSPGYTHKQFPGAWKSLLITQWYPILLSYLVLWFTSITPTWPVFPEDCHSLDLNQPFPSPSSKDWDQITIIFITETNKSDGGKNPLPCNRTVGCQSLPDRTHISCPTRLRFKGKVTHLLQRCILPSCFYPGAFIGAITASSIYIIKTQPFDLNNVLSCGTITGELSFVLRVK